MEGKVKIILIITLFIVIVFAIILFLRHLSSVKLGCLHREDSIPSPSYINYYEENRSNDSDGFCPSDGGCCD